MIARYTRPEMGAIWDVESRFSHMLEVEIAVAKAQAKLKIIPASAAKEIEQKGKFSVKRIYELEEKTKHDVIAFVSAVAENVGKSGRYVHYGCTSSDILDTAFSLQVKKATSLLLQTISGLEVSLKRQIRSHRDTLCAGRTHGIWAEPTTFGLKLAGFLAELQRNKKRIVLASQQMAVAKLSGAVGTYSGQSPKVESLVARTLKLKVEPVATQVIPRDRHAEMMNALAMLGNGLERLAVELRHLQRSEVSEVIEGFSKGQKGSSAMPHKKNPISAENITGCARLLRSYAGACMENVALWHERDISHSSVERVVFPDAYIIADYAVHRMSILVAGLDVRQKTMIDNIMSSQGQIFSSQLLLALVDKGLDRETAYYHVQRLCHSLGKGQQLEEAFVQDSEVGSMLSKQELRSIFLGKRNTKHVKTILKRVME